MAANKFATMLQKNTHKLISILVYALLEWILIILLLLNSFFTYLITKFANYFGLKPPCPWCSRLDPLLEPGSPSNSYTDLLCSAHATQISKLSYCTNHHRLAETNTMCFHCLAACPNRSDECIGIRRRIAFISWVGKQEADDTIHDDPTCSCCSEQLSTHLNPPYLLFKPSWSALKYMQKESRFVEAVDDDYINGNKCKELSRLHENSSETESREEQHQMLPDAGGVEEDFDENKESIKQSIILSECCLGENKWLEAFSPLELIEGESDRLVPLELIDSLTAANHGSIDLNQQNEEKQDHHNQICDFSPKPNMVAEVAFLVENSQDKAYVDIEYRGMDPDTSERSNGGEVQVVQANQEDDPTGEEINDFKLLAHHSKLKPFAEPSHHATSQIEVQEATQPSCSREDDSSMISSNTAEILNAPGTTMPDVELGLNYNEKITKEESTSSAKNQQGGNHHLSTRPEFTEGEEEKFPETPTSGDSIHNFQKKLLLFEKRESGTEESLDGSVVSEMDSGDPVSTVERLKTALKSERKTLSALYSELEEERSASAIAANQTMAMINRLQEEKAAMQMEALQYQRMMEEQSEYDQEALQLLNELMIKREKEKQELEKELDIYRKKVLEYEARERTRTMRRSKNGSVRSRNSSASVSNAEDIDDLSIDLNREARDEDSSTSGIQESSCNNTPGDEVINLEKIALDCVKQMSELDDSLAEFEEERLSILDQLKALEEKLLTLGDNELMTEDVSSKYGGKGFRESYECSTPDEGNELSDDEHFPERRTMGSMAKSLLPLLDAADDETEGLMIGENTESELVEIQSCAVSRIELDGKKLAIEDEVDHVYERLQALEADREFLKHCMSSIQKGDKGMDLLQEILQHLRDLRAVELRVRSMSGEPME